MLIGNSTTDPIIKSHIYTSPRSGWILDMVQRHITHVVLLQLLFVRRFPKAEYLPQGDAVGPHVGGGGGVGRAAPDVRGEPGEGDLSYR